MSPSCLGIVTIGQSPRPDLEMAFRRQVGDIEIAVEGALDGLTASDIQSLAVRQGTYPLLVRLADGTSTQIERDVLVPLVARRAASLAARRARVIVVACAGDFPRFECASVLLLPGSLLPGVVRAVSPSRCVGVVTPVEGQTAPALAKWTADGFSAHVAHAAPGDAEALARASAQLNDAPCDVVVLDCMGHDEPYREAFAAHSRHPVLLAQTIVARMAAELMQAIP